MCGIAGYLGTRTIPPERIQACLKLMRQRGPDQAEHRHFTNGVGRNMYMLFSRLAIIDLDERANQPFNSENKWIIFNGEMYNYLERRAELSENSVECCLITLDAMNRRDKDMFRLKRVMDCR